MTTLPYYRSTKRLVNILQDARIPVQSIQAGDHDMEDDEINLTDDIHIQAGDTYYVLWQVTGDSHRMMTESSNPLDIIKKYEEMTTPKTTEDQDMTQEKNIETMTVKELLPILNTLRVKVGMSELKAWKDSKTKILAKIHELGEQVGVEGDAPADELDEEARLAAADEATDELEEEAALAGDSKHDLWDIWKEGRKWKLQAPNGIDTFNKKADAINMRNGMKPAEKSDKPKAKKTGSNVNVVSLADIARDNNVRPQTARAKFRRILKRDKNAPQPVGPGKWDFAAADKDALVKLLKG